MHKEINLEEAQMRILEKVSPGPIERVALEEAWGRVLAVDITAPHSLPAAAQSAVDGYALGDSEAPVGASFVLKGILQQDQVFGESLKNGETLGVFTGGRLPSGTGAVVPHERIVIEDRKVIVQEKVKPGNNIKQAGEDFAAGDILGSAGNVVDMGTIAVLAAYGFSTVKVCVRPKVSILSLGGNIVPFETAPKAGQVRDSNGPMLAALIRQSGAQPGMIKVAGGSDENQIPGTVLRNMLNTADMVIITGGSYSAEGFEARQLMEGAGAEILYWDVAVQPGSHPGSGCLDGKLILSLSGNPAACAVGFHLFAAPAIRAMMGLEPLPAFIKARCINGFPKAAVTRRMVRGQLSIREETLEVEVLPGQKPSMLRSLLKCNALIDLPAGTPPVESGDMVRVRMIAPI